MADRRRRRRRASQDSESESESASASDSARSASPLPKPPALSEAQREACGDRGDRGVDRGDRGDRGGGERSADRGHEESECESEDGVGEAVLSDYESADPDDNASHSEGGEEEEPAAQDPPPVRPPSPAQQAPPKEEPRPPHEKTTGERQSGDGQESTDDPEVKLKQTLDDDEDRKNPAYIPRRGLFYEHDQRGASEEERPKGRNRKLWKDEGRWEHDKFREDEQAPKSREELISVYGYDIRHGDRPRPHRHRQGSPQGRDKRRWEGTDRGVRSWQSGPRPPPQAPSTITQTTPRTKPVPQRTRNYQQTHPPYRLEGQTQRPAAHPPPRGDRHASPKSLEFTAGGGGVPSGRGGRGFRGPPPDDITGRVDVADSTTTESSGVYPQQTEPLPSAIPSPAPQRDSSPSERPPERKSYSLVRRTRSRPADMGSKQTSVEDAPSPKLGWVAPGDGPAGRGAELPGRGAESGGRGAESGGLSEMDQDLARLSLSGQNWSQNPTSYIRSEIRGLNAPLHMPSGPPQFQALDEIGSNRAKRYSSQRRQDPLHLGVIDYYEPLSYQGPIYAHGEGPAPLPPQGMLVQPEMHLPHPGLHPHQSGAPITNPALYGAPPVSLSPGQPQQLLPPPFYPPPGVMTFPFPTLYPPSPQSQVTYGGVTYYDTVQQQAQPKPSPPRRTSQPVTVKAPPPDLSINVKVPQPELSLNLHATPTDLE